MRRTEHLGSAKITAVAANTFKQLLYRKRTILMSVFLVLPIALAVFWLVEAKGEDPFEEFSDLFKVLYLHILLPLITLILGIYLFNQEFKEHTVTYLFVRPIRRWEVYLGKWFGMISAMLLMFVPSLLITFLLMFSRAEGTGYWDDLIGYLLVLVLGILLYSTFFAMLGIRLKHPMLIGILAGFIWEKSISALGTTLAKLTVLYHLSVIGDGIVEESGFGIYSGDANVATSAVILLLLFCLFAGLSIRFLSAKELI